MKKITVGVPAYKADGTLRQAVESLIGQTYPIHLIHISDDASQDGTEDVGRALMAEYENVKYTRQSVNIGRTANFAFLLHQTDTEYFMWLAGDDKIAPTYVEKTLAVLEADERLSACVSCVQFVRPDGTASVATGGLPLLSDHLTNLAIYLDDPGANARFYALHRTSILQKTFPKRDFHAWDWAASAGTLLYGSHAEVPEILMTREETPSIEYTKSIRRDNANIPFARLLPLLPLTMDLIFRQKIPLKWPIIRALIKLNLQFHCNYMSLYHPRYGATIVPVLRKHLIWRFQRPTDARDIRGAEPEHHN